MSSTASSKDHAYYGASYSDLEAQDPEIAAILQSELERERHGLQLIASENFTSPAVLAALGSTLSTNMQKVIQAKDITAVVKK